MKEVGKRGIMEWWQSRRGLYPDGSLKQIKNVLGLNFQFFSPGYDRNCLPKHFKTSVYDVFLFSVHLFYYIPPKFQKR